VGQAVSQVGQAVTHPNRFGQDLLFRETLHLVPFHLLGNEPAVLQLFGFTSQIVQQHKQQHPDKAQHRN
jgi:hypothetical protein